MAEDMIEKQKRDAKNPHSHGVGLLRLPCGQTVRVAYLPESLAYYWPRKPKAQGVPSSREDIGT